MEFVGQLIDAERLHLRAFFGGVGKRDARCVGFGSGGLQRDDAARTSSTRIAKNLHSSKRTHRQHADKGERNSTMR